MLFIHSYKTNFFLFSVCLIYDDVYFEYTQCSERKITVKNSGSLYLKTATYQLDLLKRTVTIQ